MALSKITLKMDSTQYSCRASAPTLTVQLPQMKFWKAKSCSAILLSGIVFDMALATYITVLVMMCMLSTTFA